MPAPVAVYVVAAIAGVAAVIAFKEFVFEPHIAPVMERWAEDFLEKRKRRARREGPVSIPVSSTRGPGNGDNRDSANTGARKRSATGEDLIQLDPLNLDEWRNDVHRNAPGANVRRRTRVVPNTDEGSVSTTVDDSFTTLSHTPLAPTHVISNVSSPFTDTLSISTPTPLRSRTRSSSSRTASDDEHQGSTVVLFAPPSPVPPSPPFGPILPDTPRTSAAYSSRPFSPVVRTPVRSRAPSSRSSLQHSSSGSRINVSVQGSQVVVNFEGENVNVDVGSGGNANMHESSSRGTSASTSIIGSLSERYPAPPSPPVLLSPPSPHTALSSPATEILSLHSSGSRSGSPFDVVSPPMCSSALHLSPPILDTYHSATSEDEFMSFGAASDGDGDAMSAPRSLHTHNPFSDFEEGSEFESGSEGSWGQVNHGTGRR